MWDKFKVMKSLPEYSIDNLAYLAAYLITEQSVPMAFLKVGEFNGGVDFHQTIRIDSNLNLTK